ncbi:MAG: hypothetical protein WBB39_04180, partial [Candidatus Saccharimonadales bacterium]
MKSSYRILRPDPDTPARERSSRRGRSSSEAKRADAVRRISLAVSDPRRRVSNARSRHVPGSSSAAWHRRRRQPDAASADTQFRASRLAGTPEGVVLIEMIEDCSYCAFALIFRILLRHDRHPSAKGSGMKLVTVHTTNRKGKGSDAQERTLQHTHTTPAPTQRFARAGTG